MNILVTGGLGLIGHHVVNKLESYSLASKEQICDLFLFITKMYQIT